MWRHRREKFPDCAGVRSGAIKNGLVLRGTRRRGPTTERGYNREWRKLSEEARRLHPYCAVPGCTSTDLTVDHVDPSTRGKAGLTLANVQVLCRFHNSSKGANSYRVESSTTSEDPRNLWIPALDIARVRLRVTGRAKLTLRDGRRIKLLWLQAGPTSRCEKLLAAWGVPASGR